MQAIDKSVSGWHDEYKSADLMDFDGEDFYLRMVMVDMDPNDTLYLQIPADYETKTIARCLADFFPADHASREKVKSELEVEDFPELPEIYDYFCAIIDDERCGRVTLDYAINGGPTGIATSAMVYDHLALTREIASREAYRVLHLILDTYNVPFGDLDDQLEVAKMKRMFRGLYLYYLVYKQKVGVIDPTRIYDEVLDAVTYCEEQNLLKRKKALIGNVLKLVVTDHGKKQFDELYNEAQYYVSQFEMYAHVFVDDDFVRFNHVAGKDYRIQVMRHEGIDIYRAVMIMSMMNGTFDQTSGNWEQELRDEKFFARYFGACVNTETEMSAKDFSAMVEEGKKMQARNTDVD